MKNNRMIEVSLKFWTNDIGKNGVDPKVAWGSGMAVLPSNAIHGIKAGKNTAFYSIADISRAVENILIRGGIKIEPSRTMKKYLRIPKKEFHG